MDPARGMTDAELTPAPALRARTAAGTPQPIGEYGPFHVAESAAEPRAGCGRLEAPSRILSAPMRPEIRQGHHAAVAAELGDEAAALLREAAALRATGRGRMSRPAQPMSDPRGSDAVSEAMPLQRPEAERRRAAARHLAALGISLTDQVSARAAPDSSFEAPCVVQASIQGAPSLSVGAYTGIFGATIWGAQVGRFCSIAQDVRIGLSEHPTDWLSSSMVGYVPNVHGWTGRLAAEGRAPRLKLGTFRTRPTTCIGNDVWIGYGAFIRSGITIGDGAIVAAGAMVMQDVEPFAIVGGTPARVLRHRFAPDLVGRLQRSRWWERDILSLPVDFSDPVAALALIDAACAAGTLAPLPTRRHTLAEAMDA